ncbi:MAG TPA: peptide deformylase [Rhodanobacteraceae bacterium]
MATLPILEFPDPRLRAKAAPVDTFDADLERLSKDMLETMYEAKGIGLAATQVGVTKRLFVMDVSEELDTPQVLVNPRIVEKHGDETYQEGCLSFPGVFADVTRAECVTVEAEDTAGNTTRREVDGLEAICIQHELDHLDGKVFIDYLSPLKRTLLLKRLEKQRRKAG